MVPELTQCGKSQLVLKLLREPHRHLRSYLLSSYLRVDCNWPGEVGCHYVQ